MALISCPECGKQISDKAEYCIYCRFPLAYKNKPKGYQNNTMGYLKPDRDYIGGRNVSNESTNVGAAVAIIVILMIIGIAVYKLGYEPYYENKMADSLQSQDRVSFSVNSNVGGYPSGSESEIQQVPIANVPTTNDLIAKKIVSNSYFWYKDGSSASLVFQHDGNSSDGTLVLTATGDVLNLKFDGNLYAGVVLAPNDIFRLHYKYTIRGIYINASFISASCTLEGKNFNMTYDESGNYICAYTNEGEMYFKP